MKTKQLAALLAAAMILCGAAGCGDKTETAEVPEAGIAEESAQDGTERTTEDTTTEPKTETTTTSAKTTTAAKEKETGTGTNSNSGSSMQSQAGASGSHRQAIADAQAVLEQFLEACKTGDTDTILKLSNVENMLTLLGEEPDTESFRQELTELFGAVSDYSIRDGRYEADLVENINSYMADMQAQMNDADAVDLPIADLFGAFFQPIDGVCSFEVTATLDGEPETETMFVLHSGDKWLLDMALAPAMIGYLDRADEVKNTADAKSLYNAANTALTDMDIAGIDVQLLNGDVTFLPEDFANVQHIADVRTADQAMQEFAYQLTIYDSDVKNFDAVGLYIENGVCIFAAVDTTDADGTTSSATYPEISDLDIDPDALLPEQ